MPANPSPAPPTLVPPAAGRSFSFDTRTVIGAGAGLICLGLLIGFRIGHGTEPMVTERTVFRDKPHADCADCAERKLKAARAMGYTVTDTETTGVEHSTPGDSSIPGA